MTREAFPDILTEEAKNAAAKVIRVGVRERFEHGNDVSVAFNPLTLSIEIEAYRGSFVTGAKAYTDIVQCAPAATGRSIQDRLEEIRNEADRAVGELAAWLRTQESAPVAATVTPEPSADPIPAASEPQAPAALDAAPSASDQAAQPVASQEITSQDGTHDIPAQKAPGEAPSASGEVSSSTNAEGAQNVA